ncbi:MAG TPA: MFS transporter [Bryobacteraceae bacterium]|jgi:FSR family fosmidomycin resistance protein-like MFS transporter|nr:MFS transporter [Bryobacteraceae bacterium]
MSSPASTLELDHERATRSAAPAFVLFCSGHFFIDLYSIALSVLQPLLLTQFGLSLTQAGLLGGMLVFSSSVMQPVYGYLSDRFHSYLFTALAPAVAAIFISSLGLASGYGMLLAMVWIGGAAIASFHPQATANATLGIKTNRGRAMATFISSGTLGLALGPTYFSWMTQTLGLTRTFWAALPGILMSVLLLSLLRLPAPHSGPKVRLDFAPMRAVWRPLTILFLLVVIRSIVQVTFGQFLPLYLKLQRGYSLSAASYITSMYLIGGAVGGFTGGNLADRFGGRRVILLSMICSMPFLLLFVFTSGPISLAGLLLGGLILLFTIPVNVMMGQELVPQNAGTVSALMMGGAWGLAGIVFIPLTGWVSDHYSMQHAFAGLVLTPLIGFLLALRLPGSQTSRQ